MLNQSKILVTGGSGMVGKALKKLIPKAVFLSSSEYDLRNQDQTFDLFHSVKPVKVFHLAAKVGGVKANSDYIGEFYYENTMINTNVLEAARRFDVAKVVSLLSTCVFPAAANYPLTEDQVHNGEPHETNFGYAYAKRMLDVQSRAYRQQYGCNFVTASPNNLYGENDNFHLEDSHVLPAIIRKIHEAKLHNKNVVLWGDGSPLREFTYCGDIARALLFVMENYSEEHPVNIGSSEEISIKTAAEIIAEELEYTGKIVWNTNLPSGQFRKPSSSEKMTSLGWSQEEYIKFEEGIRKTCNWFNNNYPKIRGI